MQRNGGEPTTPGATLRELIDLAARETGAPESFVEHVRALFTGKGIGLDESAAPYAEAVMATFLSDARLRADTARAREHLEQLRERLAALGTHWERQLRQLQDIQGTLAETARTAEAHARRVHAARPVRPLIVPGPRDLQ